MKHPIEHDPRWQSVLARDTSADGQFVYAVKTTGVYCRPSSLSRLPRPQNVEFFDSAAAAEAAGYRPSKRAAGDQTQLAAQHAALVAAACRQIEDAETAPTLNQLAQGAGISAFHFHRVFKAATGLTPKGYANAHRALKVRQHLHSGQSVTDALYDAGFNSNSRFYETADQVLGMKPWARFWWRKAAEGCAPFCSATTPTTWCTSCRTNSRGPTCKAPSLTSSN
jgi:AraC family transcriptional regulator of adaptative response/methylated-DNA-[protein]-cysteine methyltransferase